MEQQSFRVLMTVRLKPDTRMKEAQVKRMVQKLHLFVEEIESIDVWDCDENKPPNKTWAPSDERGKPL